MCIFSHCYIRIFSSLKMRICAYHIHSCMLHVYVYSDDIKIHGSIQETWDLWQTSVHFMWVKATPFSRMCSLTLLKWIKPIFCVQISFGWGTSDSKFAPGHIWDKHLQRLYYFLCIFFLSPHFLKSLYWLTQVLLDYLCSTITP